MDDRKKKFMEFVLEGMKEQLQKVGEVGMTVITIDDNERIQVILAAPRNKGEMVLFLASIRKFIRTNKVTQTFLINDTFITEVNKEYSQKTREIFKNHPPTIEENQDLIRRGLAIRRDALQVCYQTTDSKEGFVMFQFYEKTKDGQIKFTDRKENKTEASVGRGNLFGTHAEDALADMLRIIKIPMGTVEDVIKNDKFHFNMN